MKDGRGSASLLDGLVLERARSVSDLVGGLRKKAGGGSVDGVGGE